MPDIVHVGNNVDAKPANEDAGSDVDAKPDNVVAGNVI